VCVVVEKNPNPEKPRETQARKESHFVIFKMTNVRFTVTYDRDANGGGKCIRWHVDGSTVSVLSSAEFTKQSKEKREQSNTDNLKKRKMIINIEKVMAFTPGQAILSEVNANCDRENIQFTEPWYGSWYDFLVILHVCTWAPDAVDPIVETRYYLRTGKYCDGIRTSRNTFPLTSIVKADCLLNVKEWTCSSCKKENKTKVPVCLHCYCHSFKDYLYYGAMIPGISIPLGIAHAVLQCGQAKASGKNSDLTDAMISVGFAVVDVALTPFLIGGVVASAGRVGVKAAAQTLLRGNVKKFAEAIVKTPVVTKPVEYAAMRVGSSTGIGALGRFGKWVKNLTNGGK
jgi:hypothetical protein